MVSSSRSGALLVVVTLSALLVAAAAVLLLGTPQYGAGPRPAPSGGELVIELPFYVWGLLCLLPLIAGYAFLVVNRIRNGGPRHSAFTLLSNVLVFLVAILLLYMLLHAGSGQGLVGYTTPQAPPAGNNTTPPQNNTTSSPPGSGGNATTTTNYELHLSGEVVWLVAIALSVAVGLLAIPGVIARLADRRSGPSGEGGPPADRTKIMNAMAEAAAALERGEEPRETIVRLYLRLLGELAPRAGTLAYETPEEIRTVHLAPLGVPPDAAEVLTRLFEESRYSTHPIDAPTAVRAQEAMRRAEAALRQEVVRS